MRITGDLHQKNFWKILGKKILIFLFFERFSVEKDGFLCFQLGKMVFESYTRIPSGIFGAVKLMKF